MSYIGLPFDGIDPLNIHMTLQDKTLTDSEKAVPHECTSVVWILQSKLAWVLEMFSDIDV
jgi:hypothetical protein